MSAASPDLPHTEGAIPGVCGYCGRWYPLFAADREICAERTRDAARSMAAPNDDGAGIDRTQEEPVNETPADYGDPAEWDNEFPAGLDARLAEELCELGWDVTTHHNAGVEITLPGGHETGVWLAAGGRVWTGLIEEYGTCRNPIEVTANPADPGEVAANADGLLREIAARAAKLPALTPDQED